MQTKAEYEQLKSSDMFNRVKQMESLYQIIRNSDSNFVSALDSPYGTGKTTFLLMLQGYIEHDSDDNIITVHYNAWENDFFPDPLVSLVGCFEKAIKNSNKVKISDFVKILGDISSNITNLLTFSLVNPKELLSECNQTEDRALISKYMDAVSTRNTLLNFFVKLAEVGRKEAPLKIVFLVDELDRCNPTFAIKLLESIKFFFNIPNYYFILAVHKDHLYSTLKNLYGTEIDATGYLRRFIDFDIVLNSYSINNYIDFKFEDYTSYNEQYKHLIVMYKVLCSNMKLRDIDKLYTATSLAIPKS